MHRRGGAEAVDGLNFRVDVSLTEAGGFDSLFVGSSCSMPGS